jgi:UDP-N-acetylglucosamine 2-epimerase (non-hydrolysing)
MKRVLVAIGTRPEAIKMAPVIAALEASSMVAPVVVSTGQHREMLRQVVELFGFGVDVEFDLMQPDQTLAGLTARLLTAIDEVLVAQVPVLALAQGDTTTVLATALASFYRGVPFGHVEAGLRTGDLRAPFPEEANRLLAGRLTTLHFAPTSWAQENLRREQVPPDRIFVTGNTVIDALRLELARQRRPELAASLDDILGSLLFADWRDRRIVLITGHRRESFGAGFAQICQAIGQLARAHPRVHFVYPVHLNPNVREPVHERLSGAPNVHLLEPLPYREFIALVDACHLVLTDSGGVQEEAPGLGKPVLVMRDTTERPEGVEAGTVKLVGTDPERIVTEVSRLLEDESAYAAMARAHNPYGDGHAAERIVAVIHDFLEAR